MGYISTGIGDRLSALLMSLMARTSRLKPLSALFQDCNPVREVHHQNGTALESFYNCKRKLCNCRLTTTLKYNMQQISVVSKI